jgi:thiol-disulfide isomerase/thioredoxin
MSSGFLWIASVLASLMAPHLTGFSSMTAPAREISLQPVRFEQWQGKLAGYRGQIVVVDFWATWCGPCMERFPYTVALSRKLRGNPKVRFVGMSLDDREDPLALRRARDFLKNSGADFDNYRMDEVIPDAFDKLDLLGIPAVFVYDQEGKLKYRLTGDNPDRQFKDADIDEAIRTLLGSH